MLENMLERAGVTADLYHTYWGDFLHHAVFEPGEDEQDFHVALERTHERYFAAIGGATARRILDLGTGSGAFAAWMAQRTTGEVVGVDIASVQLGRARGHARALGRANLRFVEHDVMRIAELPEPRFDAAVCLDTACYLPDKGAALRGVATCLRGRARLQLVDWCRSEYVSPLQEELILEPLQRLLGIAAMETTLRYREHFAAAGFRLVEITDLSPHVAGSWARAYRLANVALAVPPTPLQLVRVTASALRHGPHAIAFLKGQYHAVLLAKAAADAGILRYVSFVAERAEP